MQCWDYKELRLAICFCTILFLNKADNNEVLKGFCLIFWCQNVRIT